MTKRPWFPMYPGDYLNDTPHLSLAGHGLYHLLLHYQWLEGPLPDDAKILAKLTRQNIRTFRKTFEEVSPYFERKNGKIFSRRLEKERSQASERSAKSRDAANKRWDANAYADAMPGGNAKAYANGMPSQSHINTCDPFSSPSGEEKVSQGAGAPPKAGRKRGAQGQLPLGDQSPAPGDHAEGSADSVIWTLGVRLIGGKPSDRSYLGKLAQKHGKEALKKAILKLAESEPAGDPKGYLKNLLEPKRTVDDVYREMGIEGP